MNNSSVPVPAPCMGVGAGQAGQATARPIFLRKLLITKN